ncbi:hypothetical protein [Kribbella speibonae]|uniref:Uncharacterized protein n=1 Tax=Kribbella speibonae TaxID=1572660 RepID=A0ABY1ZVI0_9ACTN|nr:hypothetical protein [Kribbella speibonae]TCC16645.1 hypothetical protein E0H58_39960 [Kribbella speibonae]
MAISIGLSQGQPDRRAIADALDNKGCLDWIRTSRTKPSDWRASCSWPKTRRSDRSQPPALATTALQFQVSEQMIRDRLNVTGAAKRVERARKARRASA